MGSKCFSLGKSKVYSACNYYTYRLKPQPNGRVKASDAVTMCYQFYFFKENDLTYIIN
jgi:hypothetical protein